MRTIRNQTAPIVSTVAIHPTVRTPQFRTLAALAMLIGPALVHAQSVVPNEPLPADMPPPGLFTVVTLGYEAAPPTPYPSNVTATGDGKSFGSTSSLLFSYDGLNPADITLNFTYPIQLQYGDSPQSVLAVDNVSGAYVGESLHGRGFLATPDGGFVTDPAVPVLAGPLPFNSFVTSYSSVFVGIDHGQVVGTATLRIDTTLPLNGGDGTGISAPPQYYQFPVVGVGSTIALPLSGVFTRAMGFRGSQVVGDATSNINYNPNDSAPNPWNTVSAAWMMDLAQTGSNRLLAGVPSMAAATDGSRQGGWVGLRDGTGNYHATLWSGSAASALDLNPAGYFDSRVSGMSSEFQVGDGWLGGMAGSPGAHRHGLLWRGTVDSVMDLNAFLPPSVVDVEINGADADGNIFGSYTVIPFCAICNVTPPPEQIGFVMNLSPSVALAALTFDSSTPAPGSSVTGTVTLRAPAAAGGVAVSFTTSDSSLLPAPPDLVIPEGQASVSFSVPLNPSTVTTFMAGPASATLVAHSAFSARSATLSVTPATPVAALTALSFSPASVAAGTSVNAIVTLSQPAPAGGEVVNFNSLNTSLLATPASLLVPAGATSASLSLAALDAPPLFFGPQQVVLQAQTGNVLQQATLTVARVIKPVSVILGTPQNSFTTTQGGTSGIGFIQLTGASQVSGTIFLSNSNPAITLPASVPVVAGEWSASLPWSTLPVATLTTGTATATFNGFSSNTVLSVTASPSPSLQSLVIPITSSSQTFSSGQTLTGTITLSGPAFLGGMSVALASDTPAVAQVPPSVTVPSGATSASFSVVAGPVAGPTPVTISATLPGFPSLATVLTVIPGPALVITSYTVSPYAMIGPGVAETGTISLNQPAPAGGVIVSLSATNPQPVKFPATVSFAQGQSSVSFTVQGNSVSGVTPTTLGASYKGSLAPLGTTAGTGLTVAPTDTLHVTKATWSTSTHTLTVNATSTNPQAVITLLNASGNIPLGTMTNLGSGNYSFQGTISSIASVNLKSSLGGATGQGVTIVP